MHHPREIAHLLVAAGLALARPVSAQEQQTPPPVVVKGETKPASDGDTPPAKPAVTPAHTSGIELPANPSPGDSEAPLLPQEMLMLPPVPRPPEAGRQPSAETPFKFQLAPPVPIEPILPPLAPELAGGNSLASAMHVRVKAFRFTGNKIFSSRRLHQIVAPYEGRVISGLDLEEARQALTLKYVQAGYINSGAVLPDQDLKSGVIVFKIVEGRLTKIELTGNWWFRPWWLRNALWQGAGRPLNFEKLKTALQILRQDPNIRQINAELEPGGQPGESILKAEVKENQPFRLSLEFSNKRPPSVGAEILEVHAADLNLTGHGDPLALTWGVVHTTSETPDHWEFSGTENLAGTYEFPISPWKTTFEVHGSKSDAAIVEQPFNLLNIKSRSTQYGVMLKQPFYETLNHLFTFSVVAERRESESFLLDQPFDLSPGSIDGKTRIFVLRFILEYVNRSQQHVLALRSTVNWGIDAFHPTIQANLGGGAGAAATGSGHFQQRIPDGLFVSWLGQAQYVRRLFNTDNFALLRLNAQFATDPLVSLEQFSLGGAASVRGYRENQLLRDNGVFASAELHFPVIRNKEKNPILTVAPFFDFGAGWDTADFIGPRPPSNQIDNHEQTLYSIGTGLIFTPSKYVNAQLYWGYALNRTNVVQDGKNLQDYGLHFSISINAF